MEATQFPKVAFNQIAWDNRSNEAVDFESFEEEKVDTDQMIFKPSLISQFQGEMDQIIR